MVLLLFLLTLSWFFYPSLQPLVLKALNFSDEVNVSISNIKVEYKENILSFIAPRVELNIEDSNSVLLTLQDNKLSLTFSHLLKINESIINLDIDKAFLDLDQLKTLNWENNSQNFALMIHWINQVNIESILLKFQNDLLPIIAVNYEANKFSITPFKYTPYFPTVFNNKFPTLLIDAIINVDIGSPENIEIIANISNKDIDINLTYAIKEDRQKLLVHGTKIDVSQIKTYLPYQLMSQTLADWLDSAFVSGFASDIKLKVIHQISTGQLTSTLRTNFSDINLNFDQYWPNLVNTSGFLTSDGRRIDIYAHDANLATLSIKTASVSIVELATASPVLTAQIKTVNQTNEALDFLMIKPLKDSISDLNWLELTGRSHSNVLLNIPLINPENVEVMVENKFIDNRLTLPYIKKNINHLNAKLSLKNDVLLVQGSGTLNKESISFNIFRDEHLLKLTTFNDTGKIQLQTPYSKQLDQALWQANITNLSTTIKADIKPNFQEKSVDINIKEANFVTNKGKKNNFSFLPEEMPTIRLKSSQVSVNDYLLPKFDITLTPYDKKLLLSGSAKTKQALNIDITGQWRLNKTKISLQTSNGQLADLLTMFGVSDASQDGSFQTKVDLFCACDPWLINLDNLTGTASINVVKGILKKQDASFGRILTLLNIKALGRRLSLDTSDALNKGFFYNFINATATLDKGQLHINTFKLLSLSSNIDLTGQINLLDEQLNLTATVIPSLSDTVPLAAYLSSGSLAGLGLWLVDKVAFNGKLLDNLLNNTTSFDYKITGHWDDPLVK